MLAQLDSPRAIQELVQVGPVRSQTEWMVELLADPAITSLNVVTAPEEMPVSETIELIERAREQVNVSLGAVIVNRVLPEPFTRADEPVFAALCEPAATSVLEEHTGAGGRAVLDAARLAASLRRSRSPYITKLRDAVGLPLLFVPYLFVRDHGMRVTRMVSGALGEELGL